MSNTLNEKDMHNLAKEIALLIVDKSGAKNSADILMAIITVSSKIVSCALRVSGFPEESKEKIIELYANSIREFTKQ